MITNNNDNNNNNNYIDNNQVKNRTPREERYCLCCKSTDIEDEFHFILFHFIIACPCFTELRNKHLKTYYFIRPSVYKFAELLTNSNRKTTLSLAIYIKEATLLRNILNVS